MPSAVQTITDVVNISLGLLGQQAIQSIDDPGPSMAKFLYPVVRSSIRMVQAHYVWPELIKVVDLTVNESQTLDGYYQFPLPTDFLRLADVSSEQIFTRRGNKILCLVETAQLTYVAYSEDPGSWGEYLTEAIYYDIAGRLALPISQDGKKAQLLISQAIDKLHYNVSMADSNSDSPLIRPTDQDYVTIRDGRYSTGGRFGRRG